MVPDDTLDTSHGNGKDGETLPDQQPALKSWWAKQWLRALGQWLDAERLAEGKKYVGQDYPANLTINSGSVVAQIKGTALQPYQIHIEIDTFGDKEWERALDAMFQQAGYAAHLLNDEMPPAIEVVFRSVGLSLFPGARSDLRSHCSCGSPIVPCEHVAGVYHLLAQRLDRDPFLLFHMRGQNREQVLAGFRARRASRSQHERERQSHEKQGRGALASISLPSDSHTFWKMGPQIEDVEIDVKPPEIHMEVLKLLGIPSFVNEEMLEKNLPQIYQRVSQKALEIAYGEHETKEGNIPSSSDRYPG
ncbi:MAG: hypothetical protein ACLFV5_08420 [Anaerolineales bacterium]